MTPESVTEHVIRDVHGVVMAMIVDWAPGQVSAVVSRPLLMELMERSNPGVTVIETEGYIT